MPKSKISHLPVNLRKRKRHFELSREGRRLNKVKIREMLVNFNSYLKNMGLQLKSIEIEKQNTDKDVDFEMIFLGKSESRNTKSQVQLMDALKAVDSSNMSQRNYKGFKKTLSLNCMPSLYNLTRFKKRLNQFFELQSNDYGNFVNARQKIDYVLKKIYKRDPSLVKNNTFMLKFSGDGTNITKTSVQLLNFTFTVLNEKEICKTSAGNYILGK